MIYPFITLNPLRTADILFLHGLVNRCEMFGEGCLSLAMLVKYNSNTQVEKQCAFCNATTLHVNKTFSGGLQIKS